MKNFLFTAAILISNISCSDAQTKFKKEALASVLSTFENQNITFEQITQKHTGKIVVIEFWASWCSDCVKSMPKLKELQSKNPDVAYIFISLDKTFEKWKIGIEKHELAGDHFLVTDPEGMKSKFGKSIKLDWIPRYIILDKTGKIVLFKAIETDFDKIQKTLTALK
jgi:thiol-disulfide isomerase/thioredoxin